MGYGQDRFEKMLRRKLASVVLEDGGGLVTFTFQDGYKKSFGVSGDCCSTSWIEHLEVPADIEGATLLSVEDGGEITQDHDAHDEENGGDSIQVYNTAFKTDRGVIVLEYRNSSNGYYGGSLDEAGESGE